MAASSESKFAVVAQPYQRHQHHLELAMLTEMVNPKAAIGLGDWPAPPPPPAEYGYGGGNINSSSRHQHEQARAAKDLIFAWGLQWWTIGMLVSDCLVGQISQARRDFQSSTNPVFSSSGTSGGSTASSSANGKPLVKKRKLSDYTLIAAVQVLLGGDQGTSSSSSSRRVTFNSAPEVKYIDKCRVLYPPTLVGIETKRAAFWSKREVQDNVAKWEGHLESYELGRYGNGTACKCYGCQMDGEETNF